MFLFIYDCLTVEMLTPFVVVEQIAISGHALEARFDGRPTLLVLDEAWLLLDDPLFADRIREWLKTLRKKNVAVVFATQSLSDIADSQIAREIIESCPIRIFLPNPRALVNEAAINSVAVTEAVPNHQPSEMW